MKTRLRRRSRRRSDQPSANLLESNESNLERTVPSNLETIEEPDGAAIKKVTQNSIKETYSDIRKKLNYSTQTASSSSSITDLQNCEDVEKETFIPGAQFFSDCETPEKLTSDYFSGSDTPSKLLESTRRLSVKKPFSNYIAYSSDEELEDWWQEPKTDYTYSVSLSYRDRITPERKIGSPNMSRRALRQTRTYNVLSSDTGNLELRSRNIPKSNLDAFSESSQSVDYGLDDSDSDTAASNSLSHISKPLVRKGRTSLLRSCTPLPPDSLATPSSILVNGGGTNRMANHFSKTTVHSTVSTNGKRAHLLKGQYQNNEQISSWKDKFSEWHQYSTATIKTITSVIVTSVFFWTLQLTEKAGKLKNYIYKPNQSYSSVYLSVNNLTSERKNKSAKSQYTESSDYVKTTVMSRTQTVLTITEHFYERYQEKRRNSPFLWGWLPILLLLLLFLPLCAFWLRPPSESLGTTASSHSSRFWQSIIPSAMIQSLTDFIQWFSVVLLSFASLLWNLIIYSGSILYHFFFIVIDTFKYFVGWFWNILCHLYSSVLNIGVIPSTQKEEIVTAEKADDSSWIQVPAALASHCLNVLWSVPHTLKTSSETVLSFTSTFLSDMLITLWNFTTWLSLGLWSVIIFLSANIWTVITSIYSVLTYGTYSLLGSVSSQFKLLSSLVIFNSKKVETADFSNVKLAGHITDPNFQSHLSNDVLVAQLLLNPQLLHFIASSLEETLTRKGISKEDIDSIVRSVVSSELNVLRSELLRNEENSDQQILLLKQQQGNLLQQIRDMEMTLSEVKLSYSDGNKLTLSTKTSLEGMIVNITSEIGRLKEQFEDLQKSHESLRLEVRSCCRTTSLTLKDVENHVNLLLSDILGFQFQGKDFGDVELKDLVDSSKFGSWISSYFVAKKELETKLSHAVEEMKSKADDKYKNYEHSVEETLKQTTQTIMDNVLEKIRSEIYTQQAEIQQQLKEIDDSSKQGQETIFSLMAEERRAAEGSYSKVQAVTTESAKMAIDQAFTTALPVSVATLLTQEIDNALKKQQSELAHEVNLQLDAALEKKFNYDVNQLIQSKVAEVMKLHFHNSQDSSDLDLQHSALNIGAVPTDQSHRYHNTVNESSFALNESLIMRIVNKALSKYDADKTGMVDHALESAGGTIVSTRCTEGYQVHQAELTIFGYPIYRYSINTPRSIIQPDRMPGQCYAFKGSEGFIVIHFAGPVKVTAFSLEHIPKVLSPTGSIDSAPKDFSVYGLQTLNEEGHHLGNYVYRDNDEPLQYFPVVNYTEEYFKYVELKVNSNHGNIHYTCIYRFRVHGVRQF